MRYLQVKYKVLYGWNICVFFCLITCNYNVIFFILCKCITNAIMLQNSIMSWIMSIILKSVSEGSNNPYIKGFYTLIFKIYFYKCLRSINVYLFVWFLFLYLEHSHESNNKKLWCRTLFLKDLRFGAVKLWKPINHDARYVLNLIYTK